MRKRPVRMLESVGKVDSQRIGSSSTPSTARSSGTRMPASAQASSTSTARPNRLRVGKRAKATDAPCGSRRRGRFHCRAARGATKTRRRARGRAARSGTAGGLRRARLDAVRRPFRSVLRTEPGAWTRKRASGPTRKATKPRPAPRLRRTPRQTPRRPAPQAAGHRGDSRAGVSWIFVCREAAFVSRTREGPQDGTARPHAAKPPSRRPGFRACARSAPPKPCRPAISTPFQHGPFPKLTFFMV